MTHSLPDSCTGLLVLRRLEGDDAAACDRLRAGHGTDDDAITAASVLAAAGHLSQTCELLRLAARPPDVVACARGAAIAYRAMQANRNTESELALSLALERLCAAVEG